MTLFKIRQHSADIPPECRTTAMWAEPSLVACATWLESITATSVFPIQETHEFSRAIPVIERRPERMVRNIPSRAEDQKVHQRVVRCLRLCCQHAEDGGVDVVLRNAANVHEFLQRIFIGYVAGAPSKQEEEHARNT